MSDHGGQSKRPSPFEERNTTRADTSESVNADGAVTSPKSVRREFQPTLYPSKENWAAAQDEITSLEKEQRRRLDAQAPVMRWVRVFDEDVPENVMSDFATAKQIKDRLTAAGIVWKEHYTSRDCERMVHDPESPGGWGLELGSVTSLIIEVQEVDEQRANHVIASEAPAQVEVVTPIKREFPPRVIPSKESWLAAREEISALEREIGAASHAQTEITAPNPATEPGPKAWRNYDGEDGWDS